MTTEAIPLLIDTDPGVDDALALLLAFNAPKHAIVGITVSAGNVGLRHTLANALKLCEVAGREDVPVFAGADAPLLHPCENAAFVHGEDGFGDIGYVPSARTAASEHAAQAMIRLAHQHAGRLLLVCLGPLTNLALALKLDPTLPQRIARLVVMGGAVTGHGNLTPSAEFNTGFDPEAAHIVFSAFDRFDLCDWEATLRHPLPHAQVEPWLQAENPCARFYADISAHTRAWSRHRRGEDWHSADALAMAMALAPEGIETTHERPLQVVLGQGTARGLTVVDWERRSGRPDNARLLQSYDLARFHMLVEAALAAS